MRSADGRSPLYEELWRRLAEEPLVDELVDEYRWDTPLRLAAALNFLALGGEPPWDDVPGALRAHGAFLRRFIREHAIQTNEVQRSWILLPCFLEAARRVGADALDVIELGPSAGLNLVWDRYRHRYAGGRWGPPHATLELRGEERRPVPAELLRLTPRVRSRVGVDPNPIDLTTEAGARLLRSFVWPDQTWRLELLDRAIATLREDPPELVRGSAVEELPRLLERRDADALTLVVHTAVLDYVPPEGRRRIRDALAEAGRSGPLAEIATGRPAADVHSYWGMVVRLWPGGGEQIVEHADFHGAWLSWLG